MNKIDLSKCATAIANGLAANVKQTTAWSRWDWIRWGAPWLLLGVGIGAIVTALVDHFIP